MYLILCVFFFSDKVFTHYSIVNNNAIFYVLHQIFQ